MAKQGGGYKSDGAQTICGKSDLGMGYRRRFCPSQASLRGDILKLSKVTHFLNVSHLLHLDPSHRAADVGSPSFKANTSYHNKTQPLQAFKVPPQQVYCFQLGRYGS